MGIFSFVVLFFMFSLLAVYLYLSVVYQLNLWAMQWSVDLLDLYMGGYITLEDLSVAVNSEPWYVRLVRRIDVVDSVCVWLEERMVTHG